MQAVNLAARLMSKGKGRVLVDTATYTSLPREGRKNLVLLKEALTLKVFMYIFICININTYVEPSFSERGAYSQGIYVHIHTYIYIYIYIYKYICRT
jgi:hypothetical protein